MHRVLASHPRLKSYVVKYIKYNFFGLFVFLISSLVYWVLGSGGWLAFIMAGGIGGFVEFTLQLHFVYGQGKLFERINPKWRKYDDMLHGRDSENP